MVKIKLHLVDKILIILSIAILIAALSFYFGLSERTAEFNPRLASFDTYTYENYQTAEVEEVYNVDIIASQNSFEIYQSVKARFENGQHIDLDETRFATHPDRWILKPGDKVVVGEISSSEPGLDSYYDIVDRYRLDGIWFVVGFFVVIVLLVARQKGLMSLIGLGVTSAVVFLFLIPLLLKGAEPVKVVLVSAGFIMIPSMLIAHGWRFRTKVSIISSAVSLAIAVGISYSFVWVTKLFGFGQADAYFLELGYLGAIDMRGLFLAGLVVALLGVLDDVTTAQTAAVDEIYKANSELEPKDLYKRAMSVGQEHIASLVNTLILVYAGASLSAFLLLTSATGQPFWIVINSEHLAEEIVRAVSGSVALVLAVPISTALAVWFFSKR